MSQAWYQPASVRCAVGFCWFCCTCVCVCVFVCVCVCVCLCCWLPGRVVVVMHDGCRVLQSWVTCKPRQESSSVASFFDQQAAKQADADSTFSCEWFVRWLLLLTAQQLLGFLLLLSPGRLHVFVTAANHYSTSALGGRGRQVQHPHLFRDRRRVLLCVRVSHVVSWGSVMPLFFLSTVTVPNAVLGAAGG